MAQAMKTAQAKKTTLRPLHDRVLVKRLEEQDAKHGSLIIPDTAKEKPQEGQVVAVGTGKVNDDGKNFPLAVKEGDRILFGKYSGRSEEHTSELQSLTNLVCRLLLEKKKP